MNSASEFGGFFSGMGSSMTAGLAKGMWDRLSQGKRILFADRAGSIENEVQRAFERGEIASEADVLNMVVAYSAAMGSGQPPAAPTVASAVPVPAPSGRPTTLAGGPYTAADSRQKTQVMPPSAVSPKQTQLPPLSASATPPPPPPPPVMPPAPSRPKPQGFDYDGTTANYGTSLDDINRQRRNLYQFDSTLASAEDVRKRFGRDRDDLEKRATAGGGDDKAVQRVLSAFDKVARSAERLAERNERLGAVEAAKSARDATRQEAREAKQAEQDQAKASAEVKAQQAEELRRLREDEQAKRAAWQRMTGKSSAGDMMFGADKLERDPRGYLMNMAGLMMSGPIASRMRSMVGGTLSGANAGYQFGGLAGAAVGGAVGMSSDAFNAGKDFNKQASNTFDQSFDLLRTKASYGLALDKVTDQASAFIQNLSGGMGGSIDMDRSRRRSTAAVAASGEIAPLYMGGPLNPLAQMYGAYKGLTRKSDSVSLEPEIKRAAPSFSGVGSASPQTASIEQYQASFGMSSVGSSEQQIEKLYYEIKAQVNVLKQVADNTERLKDLTQAWGK